MGEFNVRSIYLAGVLALATIGPASAQSSVFQSEEYCSELADKLGKDKTFRSTPERVADAKRMCLLQEQEGKKMRDGYMAKTTIGHTLADDYCINATTRPRGYFAWAGCFSSVKSVAELADR